MHGRLLLKPWQQHTHPFCCRVCVCVYNISPITSSYHCAGGLGNRVKWQNWATFKTVVFQITFKNVLKQRRYYYLNPTQTNQSQWDLTSNAQLNTECISIAQYSECTVCQVHFLLCTIVKLKSQLSLTLPSPNNRLLTARSPSQSLSPILPPPPHHLPLTLPPPLDEADPRPVKRGLPEMLFRQDEKS